MKNNKSQKGFSLVEILIAMFVFSIGLGGYLALQVKSVSLGNEAYLRTQATHLADYMVSIINANDKSAVVETDVTRSVTFGIGSNSTVINVNEAQINPMARQLYFESPEAGAAWSASVTDLSTDCFTLNNPNCIDLQDLAENEIKNIRLKAQQLLPNGEIQLDDCKEGNNDLCIVIAWRKTTIEDCLGTATVTTEMDCLFKKAVF